MSAREIAARMGVNLSTVYSWGETGEAGREISLDRLHQLTLVTGDRRPLSALCAAAGGAFLPLPAGGGPIDKATMTSIADFGRLVHEVADDFVDGHIDAVELSRIRNATTHVQADVALLLAAVEAEATRRAGKI
jgi:hypothetical protein